MKYILSILVVGVILLHSVIPHEHYVKSNNTAEIQSHECTTTLFHGVELTFGLDHGAGHLEQFINVHLDVPELLLSEILQNVFVEENYLFTGSYYEEVYTSLNLPPDPLRGPPC